MCTALVLAAGWAFLRAPSQLGDATAIGVSLYPAPVAQSSAFAGLVMPALEGQDGEQIEFHGQPEIRFAENSAVASARVAVCVRDGDPF